MIGDAERVQELERENAELRDELANAGNHKACAQCAVSDIEPNHLLAWADIAQSLERENLALKKTCEELRERAEKAERELDSAHASIAAARASLRHFAEHLSEHVYQELESSLNWPNREQEDALARLARYEADGPALMVAEHSVACEALRHAWKEEIAQYDPPGLGPTEPTCNDSGCHAAAADRAYREQHARCVAVVEPALTACLAWLAAVACSDCGEPKHKCFCDCGPRDKAIDLAVAALAALTGEAEK